MKANELPINNFLQAPNIQFVIPVYQRNYDWTIKECRDLLNDIIAVEEENRGTHFIGSIVFIHEGIYSTSEVKELVIIDGQQRLTTINILYVALYRFAKKNNLDQEAEKIFNMFLINQYVKQESSKLKLKQTDFNSQAFNAILNETEKQYEKYSNVIENYNFFESVINNNNFQSLLLGLKRLIFVEISLERDKDDPQRIFESLNSTGLELSQSDLIRNYILMDLEPKMQLKLFNEIWSPIEENAKDLMKQKSLVSDYIRDYLTLRNKKIPNKSKVYEEFKKLYSNRKDEDYYEELRNIKALSSHYRKFVNPESIKDSEIKRELNYISRLEINVAYPFLLQVFEDFQSGLINKTELLQVLKLIQSYTWRRFIVGLPTNALNKIFMTLYSEVDQEDYYDSIAESLVKKRGTAKFPTNEEVKTALRDKDLYNIKSKNRNYMFEMLENYNNKEYVDTSNSDITIEHIYPRNPDSEWKNNLSSEENFLFKEKFINTIGNLTLSGNNGALSNRSFSAKRDMNNNGKEQGYRYSRLWLNSFLKEIENWNIENFQKRLELISERFLQIWEYPDIEIESGNVYVEQNIFDAESPTHKKLEYFIFEDSKVDTQTVTELYTYVVSSLYRKNPQIFFNNLDLIKISRNSTEFRAPHELHNGHFTELNMDNESKFTIIKKLLSLFELEDELIIKYADNLESPGEHVSRDVLRFKYWEQLLPMLAEKNLFTNITPKKNYWLLTGAGISGIAYTMAISRSYIRVELSIEAGDKEVNKNFYRAFRKNKNQIEENFGEPLEWEELPDKIMSRIKFQRNGLSLYEHEDWQEMNDFFIKYLPLFKNAIDPVILKLK